VAEILARMFKVYALLALFIGILAGFIVNYTLSSRNVWKVLKQS
jgi:hypothetical protein